MAHARSAQHQHMQCRTASGKMQPLRLHVAVQTLIATLTASRLVIRWSSITDPVCTSSSCHSSHTCVQLAAMFCQTSIQKLPSMEWNAHPRMPQRRRLLNSSRPISTHDAAVNMDCCVCYATSCLHAKQQHQNLLCFMHLQHGKQTMQISNNQNVQLHLCWQGALTAQYDTRL